MLDDRHQLQHRLVGIVPAATAAGVARCPSGVSAPMKSFVDTDA
jgi:hypothetical protein